MHSSRYPVALAMLSLLLAAPFSAAQTQADDYRFALTPYGGYRFGGEFQQVDTDATAELDDSPSFGLILSGRDSNNTNWEVLFSRQSTDVDTTDVPGVGPSTDLDMTFLQLGGTYEFDGDVARPFIAATFGGARFEPNADGLDDDTFWAFTFGTGLHFRPNERLGFRLEARAWGTVLDSDSKILCVSGPAVSNCSFAIKGDVLWQVETFAGVTFRF
mgnify:CR=1 FL=1